MNLYGVKVISDKPFSHNFHERVRGRDNVTLVEGPSEKLKNAITCGFPLYYSHGRKVYLYSDRILDSCLPGQPWCHEVKDIVSFYWQGGTRTIYYEYGPQGGDHLLEFWFVHLFFPLFLTMEGMCNFIHAGAVEVGGKPVLFIAPSTGGKSTITKYFLEQGHALISDDKVPAFSHDGHYLITGSHPYHRPYRGFEDLGYYCDHFFSDFKAIGCFFVMKQVGQDDGIVIEEINGADKFLNILPNALYTFEFTRENRMLLFSSILNSSRMFTITIPWTRKRQHQVYKAICNHCRSQL